MSAPGDPLRARLAERIRRGGPLPVAAYMEACLADPQHGYYRTRDPLGAAGDFTTSPEISQIFGELIGLALAQAWLDQGAPRPVALVELGPGRGRLIADALRAARAAPGFIEAVDLYLVETSQPLRAAQAEALSTAPIGPRWTDRLADVPRGPLLLVANEFFDALPIRQWRKTPEGWRERCIDLAEPGDAFTFTFSSPDADLDAPDAPDGAWFERSPLAEAIAAEIGARIAADGGAALVIDYGYDAAQRAAAGWPETFQAVRAHAYADPLATPGDADLTAHVDFTALSQAAARAGAAVSGPIGQGLLLRRLGAEARAAALARANPSQTEAVAAALGRLTDPREMGVLFKALGLTAIGGPPIAGF